MARARFSFLHENVPAVTLLRTIPGVGPRTAEALVAYIDDVKRFGSVNCTGAYFGLLPSLLPHFPPRSERRAE